MLDRDQGEGPGDGDHDSLRECRLRELMIGRKRAEARVLGDFWVSDSSAIWMVVSLLELNAQEKLVSQEARRALLGSKPEWLEDM